MKHTEATGLLSAHPMSNPLTMPLKHPWGQERAILGIAEIAQLVKCSHREHEDPNLIPRMCYSSEGKVILAVGIQGIPQHHIAQLTSHKRHRRPAASAEVKNRKEQSGDLVSWGQNFQGD